MSDVTGGSSIQSSLASVQPKVFSLASENDVIALLKHIHQSPMDSDDKNELRDAIFMFRNSSQATLTPELIAKFADYDFALGESSESTLIPTEVSQPAVVQTQRSLSQFGASRPSPQFSKRSAAPPTVPSIPVVAQNPTEPVLVQQANEVVSQTSIAEPTVAPFVPEPSVVPQEAPMPEAPAVEVVVSPGIPQVSPQAAPPINIESVPERIKEIKKQVNLLVGNPVNLIDVNNEVGREYMNALLDAMKKNNGGTPEQVTQAMGRLETAFESVKKTVGVVDDGVSVEPIAESSVVAAMSDVVEPPMSVVPDPVVAPEISVSQESVAQPEKEQPVVPSFSSVHQTHVQESVVTAEPQVPPEVQKNEPISIDEAVSTTPSPSEPSVTAWGYGAQSEQKTPAQSTGGIMSVAKEKQIHDLMTAEKQQTVTADQQRKTAEIASMNPLMTPEVTNGLQQLLSEWSLFKSSGIFGTGPSGMEHPLFKKLAILNMTAVVAGRFEGATPEIKRSITDYMNGWRYEEGIMQEQGELFEHYLRRVIKHILDKRK